MIFDVTLNPTAETAFALVQLNSMGIIFGLRFFLFFIYFLLLASFHVPSLLSRGGQEHKRSLVLCSLMSWVLSFILSDVSHQLDLILEVKRNAIFIVGFLYVFSLITFFDVCVVIGKIATLATLTLGTQQITFPLLKNLF